MDSNRLLFKQTCLKPGDKVAILSPSSGLSHLFPWVYEQGLRRIREVFELETVEFPTARQSSDYLAKHPQARAEDINQAFADPSIKGLIATSGGNDQIRILPYLDQQVIVANPKVFMGYSDCTNLHLYLWNLRIVSYYGGSVMTQFAMGGGMHDYTVDSIRKAIFYPPIGEIKPASYWSDADLDWTDPKHLNQTRPSYQNEGWKWHNNQGQKVQGRLWGGCLEILYLHLSVRQYLPSFKQLEETVLFIETSEEMPSEGSVYRFIAALGEMGLLNCFKAILVAYPKAQFMGMKPPEGREAFISNQQSAIKKALTDYNAQPLVVFNLNFGHTDPQLMIPNGGMVRIDGSQQTISFN